MWIEDRSSILRLLVGARLHRAGIQVVHLDLVGFVALGLLRGRLDHGCVPELLRLLGAEPAGPFVAGRSNTMEGLASLRAVGAETAANRYSFLVREVDLVPCCQ